MVYRVFYVLRCRESVTSLIDDSEKFMTVDKYSSSDPIVSTFKRRIFIISLHIVTETMLIGHLQYNNSEGFATCYTLRLYI